MFTAFSQYFIKAPLVAITASSLFDYDATFLAFLVLGSFSHSSLQNLWNSIEFDGECNCTAIFRPLQKYSIGFKCGLWLGQLRIFRAVPNPLLCYDACVLKVVVLLEDELEPDESEVQSTGCLQTWHLELMSNSSIFVLSDQRILFLVVWESFKYLFEKLQAGCYVLILVEWLLSCESTLQAWSVKCFRHGCCSHIHCNYGTLYRQMCPFPNH